MRLIVILSLLIVVSSCGTTDHGVKQFSDIPEECLRRCRIPIAGSGADTIEQMDMIDAYNAEVHGECISRHHCAVDAIRERQK